MKNILKYINSLPFELTVPHYHTYGKEFGRLDTPEAWDKLRETHRRYAIPASRAEWLTGAKDSKLDGHYGLEAKSAYIADLMRIQGLSRLISIGCGDGTLEYMVGQKNKDVAIVATEYNEVAVERLAKVFTEAEVLKFDLLRDNWDTFGPLDDALVLIYRVDPQLSDEEWRYAFYRMSKAKVPHILYIPSNMLTVLYGLNLLKRALSLWKDGNAVFAGYIRTKTVFQSYFEAFKVKPVTVGDQKSFLLTYDH